MELHGPKPTSETRTGGMQVASAYADGCMQLKASRSLPTCRRYTAYFSKKRTARGRRLGSNSNLHHSSVLNGPNHDVHNLTSPSAPELTNHGF